MNDKLQKIIKAMNDQGITDEQIIGAAEAIMKQFDDAPVIPEEGAWCAFNDVHENPLDDEDLYIRKFSKYESGEYEPYMDHLGFPWRYCIEIEPPREKVKGWHWPKPDDSTPVDTPVWVRDEDDEEWRLRYLSDKKQECWAHGYTSSEEKSSSIPWDQIVLADPNDRDRRPPRDLEV